MRAADELIGRILNCSRIPQRMRRAYTLLRSGKPGPVMLEVPVDVATETLFVPVLFETMLEYSCPIVPVTLTVGL